MEVGSFWNIVADDKGVKKKAIKKRRRELDSDGTSGIKGLSFA